MNEEQEKNVSSLENAQLLEPIAQYVAAAIPKSISDNLSQFWRSIPAGAFVTVYKALPPSSENVYCCMSNGDYVPHNSVLANIHQSAEICTTKDSRRFGGGAPIANELCLFAPRAVWLPLGLRAAAIGKMRADKQRALLVEITESNDDAESRRSQAVYLPDVWNERPEWSAAQLIDSLTEKAGGIRIHAKGQKEPFVFVYEIPCFVVADESISIVRHDRGFFASIVLQRCLPFYNRFRRADRLAYSVTAEGEAQYDNEGAIVRSYADGSAFFKLCRLLSVERAASESVADTLFDRFPCSETQKEKNVYERESSLGVEKNGACLAARIALMLDIGRSVPETELWSLAQSYPNSDASFANPQIVVSLSRAYALLPIARGENELRKRISDVGIDFCRRFKERATVAAKENGAFAANWNLQAIAACKTHIAETRVFNTSATETRLAAICRDAVKRARSVTEQVCAAHGLLSVGQFDHDEFDWLAESWARLQARWREEADGAFRYFVEEPWYRTDVTSHVVEVALLLRAETQTKSAHLSRKRQIGVR